jgi:hypothetical protein
MGSAVSKQSGKGHRAGVTSEVSAFFDVLPGHQEELRAAARRFTEAIRNLDPAIGIRTGLRDTRHVIFDDGLRLLWCASFEGEWDEWVDDGLFLIGAEHFVDWLRHTDQGKGLVASAASLTAVLQSRQAQAAAYFDPLGALTLPEIVAAQRLFRRSSFVNDGLEEVSMTMKNSTGHPGVSARRSRGDAR